MLYMNGKLQEEPPEISIGFNPILQNSTCYPKQLPNTGKGELYF